MNEGKSQIIYGDLDVKRLLTPGSIAFDDGGIYIPHPRGGARLGAIGELALSGAIKITLPQSWTNTIIKFAVDIFDSVTNKSFTIFIAGFTNSTTSVWENCSSYIVGNSMDVDYSVRFGHDGTKCCIYIGETTSAWSYLNVIIRDVYLGYSNYQMTKWNTNWLVSLVASFGTVTQTISNCMAKSSRSKISDDTAALQIIVDGIVDNTSLDSIRIRCGGLIY